ncbi:aldose epimerase family protein [Methylobacterium sp. A54F]
MVGAVQAGRAYGWVDGAEVRAHALESRRLRVEILDYGGVIARIAAPDRRGRFADVALGLPNLAGYRARSPHFGALTGRFANRIAEGRFSLDGTAYRLPVNAAPHTLHGGPNGFDKRIWRVEAAEPRRLVLHYRSPDGEEGFPGNLDVTATYSLPDDETLRIDYLAWTDRPTVVNLTNHSYFNLAGEGTGDVFDHAVALAADAFLPTDPTQIPTGEVRSVAGTPFDFREAVPLGRRIRDGDPQLVLAKGYDHAFVLRGTPGTLRPAARCTEPASGRTLEIATTQPAVQLYTGNNLDGTLVGPSGRTYRSGDGVCFETQGFPDAPNQPAFPSAVLRPGERYQHATTYRFTAG